VNEKERGKENDVYPENDDLKGEDDNDGEKWRQERWKGK
jgi:hypothetical protein